MRFGAPLWTKYSNPDEWVGALKALGYNAAYCPVGNDASDEEIREYRLAAEANDLVIAEVGVWNNPLNDPSALEICKRRLELAEKIGARCAVNISGSRGDLWDGPDARNYLPETMDLVVRSVREILDDVKPKTAKYAIETMPWMVPFDAESSLELVRAVDRAGFGIHYDPVNIVVSPRHFYESASHIRQFVEKVGAHIVAVHVKDIALGTKLTVHLDEVRLGLGGFDAQTLIREVQRLDPELPMLLEHLESDEEYRLAAEAFRGAAEPV
ncbi:MAG TPA: sugar phosphate isomerase/epimerase [Fimbriimonas sp.]